MLAYQLRFPGFADFDPKGPQSKAEAQFLYAAIRNEGWLQMFPSNDDGLAPLYYVHPVYSDLLLFVQMPIDEVCRWHTADFVFRQLLPDGSRRNLVVEIDGWPYHKTEKQIARDNQVAREVQRAGWNIQRYQARQVLRSHLADATYREVHRILMEWMTRRTG